MSSRVGIVVPTLGKRLEYLSQCLKSIKNASKEPNSVFVVLVAHSDFDAEDYLKSGMVNKLVPDPGKGLAEAINAGFAEMPSDVTYINWLGDDDLVASGSIELASLHLDNNPKTVLAFGGCDYIDPNGKVLWTNKSGAFAVPLLRFGPDLIPQPGALFRKSSFYEVGGLNSSFDWAFDFDLFIKLSKIGKLAFLNRTLSSFRWHPESLSVEYRRMSVSEASKVRVSHLPDLLKLFSWIWEYPVRQATFLAGNRVTAKAKEKVV